MSSWPDPTNRRTISLQLDMAHLEYVDARARYRGCTRAAYIRQLIVDDMESQQAQQAAAA